MPPPIHGAAMMGKYIYNSKIINNTFDCHYINLATAKNLKDIGKVSLKKIFFYFTLLKEIYKEITKTHPALVYVTPNAKGGAFYKDFLIVMMLKVMGQNVVIHYHNKGVSTRQNKFVDNILYRIFFKSLKVILLADTLYNDVCKYVNRKDVYICPNGIPATIKLERKEHDGFNILFLSNMMREKGIWDLVDACKILKDKGLRFHCHFVGKWSDISEEAFNDKINTLELQNNVNAYGAKYGEDKNKFFQIADVFTFPTFYNNECFPLVLLEAMEQGIPCISCNEGGISDIIDDGLTGFVIQKNQPKILAEKLEELIKNPDLCNEMGRAGRKKFEQKFTSNQFERKITEILNDILKKDL